MYQSSVAFIFYIESNHGWRCTSACDGASYVQVAVGPESHQVNHDEVSLGEVGDDASSLSRDTGHDIPIIAGLHGQVGVVVNSIAGQFQTIREAVGYMLLYSKL